MKRGIVIGARINTTGGVSMDGSVEIQDILKWILYWDEIAYAGVGIGEGSITGNQQDDISFLESEGIFRTEIVKFSSGDVSSFAPYVSGGLTVGDHSLNQLAAASVVARILLLRQLISNAGDIWTTGQSGGEDLLLPNVGGTSASKDLIDVQLVNCLPVPTIGTPFDDILEFKNRHRDELGNLRRCLDQLRENILSSSDERRATDTAIRQIVSSISDIRAALQGSGIRSVLKNISLYTKSPSFSWWTAMGGMAAGAAGIPIHVGMAAGAGADTLITFFRRSIVGGHDLPEELADFAYVYEATRLLDAR